MTIKCIICGDSVDLENMSVVICGHVFHGTCLNDLVKSRSKPRCPVSKCNTKLKEDNIIETRYTDQSDELNDQNQDQNTQVLCTICNDELTDVNNMAVTKCGHLFHHKCAAEYVKPRAKSSKCLVESCEHNLTLSRITKVIPNHIDLHENVQHTDKTAKTDKVWTDILNVIKEAFANRQTISHEESKPLMKRVGIMLHTLQRADMKSVAAQTLPDDDSSCEQSCDDCEKKEHQIETLKTKMSDMKEIKERYQREIKNLKAREAKRKGAQRSNQELLKLCVDLRNKNARKTSEVNSLIEELETMIQKTEGQVTPGTSKEGQTVSNVTEMDVMKEKYERLKKDIRKLESNYDHVKSKLGKANTEMTKVKDENETLKKNVETLQSQLSSVKSELNQAKTLLPEMNKMKEENDMLQKEIQSLQSQLSSVSAQLGEANSQLSEMNRENKVLLKDVQGLQSEVITARDANIDLQSEMRELAIENEKLAKLNNDIKKLNNEMKSDLKQLKDTFAIHESSTTDFMMNEVQRTLQQDAVEQELKQHILTLQADNDNLRRDNHELRTENKYRWELLTTLRNAVPCPEDIPR